MKQNVGQGYRAGGRASYGYRLETIEMGKHRNGDTLTKTRLQPNPETAPIAKEYFERRVRFEARKSILDDFHLRGIKPVIEAVKRKRGQGVFPDAPLGKGPETGRKGAQASDGSVSSGLDGT